MKNSFKILISVAIAALFLWLSFKNVAFDEILEASRNMSWGWVLPFAITLVFAHFIRAERWRLLFHDEDNIPHRSTLFSGVMFGYLTNIALPRVGEVARPVYVAKQIGESNSKLIGTIVLERIIDVVSMLTIMIFVGVFLISDPEILNNLFGIDFSDPEVYQAFLIWGAVVTGSMILGGWMLYRAVKTLSTGDGKLAGFIDKIRITAKSFFEGVLSIRKLKNWPLFVVYTALIWVAYVLMMYFPMWMFDLHTIYDLSIADAVVLTMVSAVGISIPTPGGTGSYHLFITYSLFVLYAIPEVTGLAFATITHAATILMVLIVSPTMLAVEKYLSMKREADSE